MRVIDKLLDGQLHGFDYEVRAVGNPNCKVIGEEVCSKFITKWMAVGMPRGQSLVGSEGSL